MKVGIVTTWFERGAAYVSKIFKEQLESAGHEVFIYARGGESYGKGDPIWDLPCVTWGERVKFPVDSFIVNKCFQRWLDKTRPEVVIFNEQRWLPPIIFCRDRKIKVGAYIDYYTEEMMPTFMLYDFLICNTKKHLSAFEWHPQVYFIPWGTNTQLYMPSMDCKEGNVTFFHSAGMNPFRKGTDLAILAFYEHIHTNNGCGHLIVHTQLSDLEVFFHNSRQCHNSSEVVERMRFLMDNRNLSVINKTVSAPGLYHLGDVYIYPSRLDGLGLTVAEALSCGLPCVVPDDGPMNEFIIGDVGYICSIDRLYSRTDGYYWPQNIVSLKSLVDAYGYYSSLNRFELQEKSASARSHALEKLNADINFSLISDVVQNSKKLTISDDDYLYAKSFHPKKYYLLSKFAFIYQLYSWR